MDTNERERFEESYWKMYDAEPGRGYSRVAIFARSGRDTESYKNGDYLERTVERAWLMWQAALRPSVSEEELEQLLNKSFGSFNSQAKALLARFHIVGKE